MFVAHFFPHSEITSAHASYQGSNLPFMTFVLVTSPFDSATVMFWFVGRPLSGSGFTGA